MIEYLDRALCILRGIRRKGPVVLFMEKGAIRQKFVDSFIGYYDVNSDVRHISEDLEHAKKEYDQRRKVGKQGG